MRSQHPPHSYWKKKINSTWIAILSKVWRNKSMPQLIAWRATGGDSSFKTDIKTGTISGRNSSCLIPISPIILRTAPTAHSQEDTSTSVEPEQNTRRVVRTKQAYWVTNLRTGLQRSERRSRSWGRNSASRTGSSWRRSSFRSRRRPSFEGTSGDDLAEPTRPASRSLGVAEATIATIGAAMGGRRSPPHPGNPGPELRFAGWDGEPARAALWTSNGGRRRRRYRRWRNPDERYASLLLLLGSVSFLFFSLLSIGFCGPSINFGAPLNLSRGCELSIKFFNFANIIFHFLWNSNIIFLRYQKIYIYILLHADFEWNYLFGTLT